MFKPGLDEEQRLAVARGLCGRALSMLIESCVRAGDIQGLHVLQAAGHFNVDGYSANRAYGLLDEHRCARRVLLHAGALPFIDALGAVIGMAQLLPVSHPVVDGSDAALDGQRLVLKADAAVADFVRRVCLDTLQHLKQLHVLGHSEATPRIALDYTLKSTASVVAAIAAALDDGALLDAALAVDADVLLRLLGEQLARESLHLQRVTPAGIALVFSSLNVLRRVDLASVCTQIHPLAMVDKGTALEPQDAMQLASLFVCKPPHPQVVAAIARGMLHGGEASTHPLVSKVFGGEWRHAVPEVMDSAPELVRSHLVLTLRSCLSQGMRQVAQTLAQLWEPGDRFLLPASEESGESGLCEIVESHPVVQALSQAQLVHSLRNPQDIEVIDQALVLLLQRMREAGVLHRLVDARVRLPRELFIDRPLAHIVAYHGLDQSIIFLSRHGMDLTVRDVHGNMPLQGFTLNPAQCRTKDLLGSVIAHQQAVMAVHETDQPGTPCRDPIETGEQLEQDQEPKDRTAVGAPAG